MSYRTTQLFFRAYNEELKVVNVENQGNGFDLISNTELIVEKCDRVIKDIQHTKQTIMYNDIKILLKKAIYSLKDIRKYLGHQGKSETINFNDNSHIDSQDKEFISQNFLSVSKMIPERHKEKRSTFKDIIERKPHFSYSASMLNDYINTLDKLGHD